MKKDSQLRVSEWNKDAPAASDAGKNDPFPPPRPNTKKTAVAKDSTAATKPEADVKKPSKPSALPIPQTVFFGFDLLRLPFGLLRRWWLSLPLCILGLVLGVFAGLKLFEVYATTSARLITRNPEAFATSRTAYTPSRIQGATLLQALAAPQVADQVASRLDWDMSGRRLAEMVNVQEVRRTDFVDIVVYGPLSTARAAMLAAVWAEEAIAFTSSLQVTESTALRHHLHEQLTNKERELQRLNERIAALRMQSGVVDAQREIDAYLRSLATLNTDFETNRVDLEALGFQLASLRNEIRKHSPGFEELKAEEARLEELAEYYTPQNPIFQDAKDRVETLRRRVNRSMEEEAIDFSEFTGTYVGNALYLQILELESRRQSLLLQQEKIEVLRTNARERLRDLPELAMEAGRLMETAQSIAAGRDALANRLQEVAGFEELAPGYFRIFRLPKESDVYIGSRTNKVLFVGFFGGAVFFGLGLLGGAVLEFLDGTLRTSREAANIFGAESLAVVPAKAKLDDRQLAAAAQKLWADVISPLQQGQIRVFWCPQSHPAEKRFWQLLGMASESLASRVLVYHPKQSDIADLAQYRSLPQDQIVNAGTAFPLVRCELPQKELVLPIQHESVLRNAFPEIWLVLHGPLNESTSGVLAVAPDLIVLCALGVSMKSDLQVQASLLRNKGNLRGTVGFGSFLSF
jgi:hypothetical protein